MSETYPEPFDKEKRFQRRIEAATLRALEALDKTAPPNAERTAVIERLRREAALSAAKEAKG